MPPQNQPATWGLSLTYGGVSRTFRRQNFHPDQINILAEIFFVLLSSSVTKNNITIMFGPAPSAAKQALRLCIRQRPYVRNLEANSRYRACLACHAHNKRTYVSQTSPANATVNVATTIKAEQKAFLKNTGVAPGDVKMPTTGISADSMMSPTAGEFLLCSSF